MFTRRRTAAFASKPSSEWYSLIVVAVLVVLPSVALMLGLKVLAGQPSVGLPLLAIFGIVILLGALAVMSALFSRLGLANCSEALGLPPGSIRAAIALSLIVLFALIAVMLYQSLNGGSTLTVSAAEKDRFLADPLIHVSAVTPMACEPGQAADCKDFRYVLHLETPPSSAAIDIAKQLLTLIGTLMTSVVSYYFAAKASESAMKAATEAVTDHAAAETVVRQAALNAPLPDLSSDTSLR
ncbi:hypothetical protein [Roseateles asaccharophilus]|uniref:Uncharacterized protein n=1 Tax=Roseateles asaccharophilus TaxID=582607 RepID=A0ABU2A510_9BURK|nr:hypothetical protein [Roseateles asaccharophilus]MDR7331708.1 hypothetical protein [Roseateles asaccharophilus]